MRDLALVLPLLALTALGYAADQTILGKQVLVRDPKPGVDATKRKIVGQGKESASPNTIVGDPTVSGAVLTIFTEGATSANQVFNLGTGTDPATGKPYWSTASTGFTYKDKAGTNSAVKVAQIKRSNSGTFQIKVVALAKNSAISLVPPNPGTSACLVFAIGGGDRYHVLLPPVPNSAVKKNDVKTFQIKDALTEGLCSETATPTTTSTTSTTIPPFCVGFYQPCGSTCGGRGRCLDGAGGLVCVDLASCTPQPFPGCGAGCPSGQVCAGENGFGDSFQCCAPC
jgi:hypothetical protein